MALDNCILPQRNLKPRIEFAEFAALKSIVRVMAAMLAQEHERASGLSAQSYLNVLSEFCIDDLAKTEGPRSGDPSLDMNRLAAIRHVSAILSGMHCADSKEKN